MVAGFALNTVGAISQNSYARAAAMEQERMARLEADNAIDAADQTRRSAEAALTRVQEDTITQGEQRKSDLARAMDQEMAALINITGARGQMGTTSTFRQLLQANYFAEIDAGRIDQEVKGRVAAFQRDKEQVVQDQARVLNNSSLNYYNAATQSRLQKAQATQGMLFSIVSAGVNLGMQNNQRKMLGDITSAQRASQIGIAKRGVPNVYAPLPNYLGDPRLNPYR